MSELDKFSTQDLIDELALRRKRVIEELARLQRHSDVPTQAIKIKNVLENITIYVAEYYGISIQQVLGDSRHQECVTPRHVSMFLCHDLTNFSYAEIGRYFGGRDHATVIHAVHKIDSRMETDRILREQVQELKKGYRTDET